MNLPEGWYFDANGVPRTPEGGEALAGDAAAWFYVGGIVNHLAACAVDGNGDPFLPSVDAVRAVRDAVEALTVGAVVNTGQV